MYPSLAQSITEHYFPACFRSNKAIGTLCPFQDDIGPLVLVVGKESFVQGAGFSFQYTGNNRYSCSTNHGYALARHFCKGIFAGDHNFFYAFLDYQFRAGRCFAIMGAGFQAYI
ncbi:hypothetical protein D9M68_844210 [compost metagenome]